MEELKPLRPLALVLKQFLFERNLSNPYTGGLSSYCLGLCFSNFCLFACFFLFCFVLFCFVLLFANYFPFLSSTVLMIASFLRVNEACTSTGALLVHFLTFFGRHFQFHKMGISISKRFIFVISPLFSSLPSPIHFLTLFYFILFFRGYFYLSVPSPTLVIEDPFDSSVNIGKGVFAMYRIKAAFNYALSALLSPSPYPYDRAPRLLSRVIDLNWQGKCLRGGRPSSSAPAPSGWKGREERRQEKGVKQERGAKNVSVPSLVSSLPSSPPLTQSPVSSISSISHFPTSAPTPIPTAANPPAFSSSSLPSNIAPLSSTPPSLTTPSLPSPSLPPSSLPTTFPEGPLDGGEENKRASKSNHRPPRRQFSQAELRSYSIHGDM